MAPRALVDAIIFLAPISCFDEMLAEDRRVNRLVSHHVTSQPVVHSLSM